jgi:putative transcriptional regulator
VLPAESEDAFMDDPERLWHDVLRRQGGDLAFVATFPEDPSLN